MQMVADQQVYCDYYYLKPNFMWLVQWNQMKSIWVFCCFQFAFVFLPFFHLKSANNIYINNFPPSTNRPHHQIIDIMKKKERKKICSCSNAIIIHTFAENRFKKWFDLELPLFSSSLFLSTRFNSQLLNDYVKSAYTYICISSH